MKQIPLTQGKYALVDDEDYDLVSQYKWYISRCSRRFYAMTTIYNKKTRRSTQIKMSHLIKGKPLPGMEVDHKFHYEDYIDNRKSNLRVCTRAENKQNQRKQLRHTSSQYKGVVWNKQRKDWQTQIQVNKKYTHLGYFTNETEAARAYNAAAIKYFGEFANLNDVSSI